MTIIPAVYVAKDGKKFDNKDDCLDYEYQITLENAKFVMLDDAFKPTDYPELCTYLETHSLDELELFNTLRDACYCVTIPTEYYDSATTDTLHFYWDDAERRYGCVEEDIKKSLDIIDKFKKKA